MAYYNYQNEPSQEKAVWNIDDEILKIIKDLKVMFLLAMRDWRLEDAHWYLDLMCTECDAKLKKSERTEMDTDSNDLEKARKEYLGNNKKFGGKFYVQLKNLYKKLNLLMKEHGVWFREQEDDEGL